MAGDSDSPLAAFMVNHITWEEDCLEPCLQVDVILKITLEVWHFPSYKISSTSSGSMLHYQQILGVRRRRVIAQILTLLLTRAESNALSGMSMSCDVGIGTVSTAKKWRFKSSWTSSQPAPAPRSGFLSFSPDNWVMPARFCRPRRSCIVKRSHLAIQNP